MDVVRFAKKSKFVAPLTAPLTAVFCGFSLAKAFLIWDMIIPNGWKWMVQMIFLFISRFHASSWGGVIWSTFPFCSFLVFGWCENSQVSLHLKLPRRFKKMAKHPNDWT